MNDRPLTILLNGGHDDGFVEAVAAVAPAAEILTREQARRDPSLLQRVDIIYGHLPPERFDHARRLKWVHATSAGVGWVQAPAVQAHPAVVTNSRFHGPQVSEQLWAMLLMLVRGVHEAYRSQWRREWKRPRRSRIDSLPGRRLCVLGLGVIGRYCARLGAAHEMHVVGLRRAGGPVEHVERVFAADELDEAVAGAEVVMNLLPGSSATEKLIGAGQFERMADGAFFLNAGRGRTVDTDALMAALATGSLGGAGLDVTDPEPLPADHPLWQMPNVIITAHYGGNTHDYDRQAGRMFLDNLRRFLAGEDLLSVVDKQAGY